VAALNVVGREGETIVVVTVSNISRMKICRTKSICVLVVICLSGCKTRPHRPANVSASAVWIDGVFIECSVAEASHANRCTVYKDSSGEVQISGLFQLSGAGRKAEETELRYQAFDGSRILLQDARTLYPILLLEYAVPGVAIKPQEQKFEYTKQAELDAEGNIYVSSDKGKLIKMADTRHCGEVRVADDLQTVGCSVPRRSLKIEVSGQVLRLEIYLKGGHRKTIETGAPILEWHFWNQGQQVTVYSGASTGSRTYALYDAASARLIEKLPEPSEKSLLPQWAKDRAQIEDESLPGSAALTQDRRMWIAKVLQQIGNIKPGMRRKNLLKFFTTEGGISTRFQRTYVHRECPYIKVNVRFRVARSFWFAEDPDDIIESISQPYLAWSVMD
jgi:hypothetical protein